MSALAWTLIVPGAAALVFAATCVGWRLRGAAEWLDGFLAGSSVPDGEVGFVWDFPAYPGDEA